MKTGYKRTILAMSLMGMVCSLPVDAFAQAGPPGAPPGGPPGAPPGGAPPRGFRFPEGASGLTLDQVIIQTGAPSTARGVPGPAIGRGRVGPSGNLGQVVYSTKDGEAPEGYAPLERDLFSSDDFYVDRDLWLDPRYYRCASPSALEGYQVKGDDFNSAFEFVPTGDNFPQTAAWGHCDIDFALEDIVSPYPFSTAQEHYDALMAEAKSHGGPTQHTYETLPRWNGSYVRAGFKTTATDSWVRAGSIQASTYVKLLTPEYQQRMVQQMYHTAVDGAPEYPGAYCWPEGYMRQWVSLTEFVSLVPEMAQFMTTMSEVIPTQVMIGEDFNMDGSVPNLLGDVRQWYGDTVGFWDGDVLVSWRSNIKGWVAHGWFEWSNQMQAIEIYSPITDMNGKFVGITQEAILYDPEALAKPVRIVQYWEWAGALNSGVQRMDWRVCNQTLFPIDGRQAPVTPGTTFEFTLPDWSNRPWAQIWETYFEEGMQRPQTDVLAGFN